MIRFYRWGNPAQRLGNSPQPPVPDPSFETRSVWLQSPGLSRTLQPPGALLAKVICSNHSGELVLPELKQNGHRSTIIRVLLQWVEGKESGHTAQDSPGTRTQLLWLYQPASRTSELGEVGRKMGSSLPVKRQYLRGLTQLGWRVCKYEINKGLKKPFSSLL